MNFKPKFAKIGKVFWPRVYLGLPLLILGLVMWNSRPKFDPIMFPAHGEEFSNHGGETDDHVGPRPDICSTLGATNGYVLISGFVQINHFRDQAFFQTADNEDGVFFELSAEDLNLIRLGIHLKDGSTALIGFKSQMSYRKFNYAILLTGNGTVRIVGDKRDVRAEPGLLNPSCENMVFGLGNGNGEFKGSVVSYVSTDTNLEEINKQLDDYLALTERNVPSTLYQWPLYSGILLLLLGFPRRKRSTNN